MCGGNGGNVNRSHAREVCGKLGFYERSNGLMQEIERVVLEEDARVRMMGTMEWIFWVVDRVMDRVPLELEPEEVGV